MTNIPGIERLGLQALSRSQEYMTFLYSGPVS